MGTDGQPCVRSITDILESGSAVELPYVYSKFLAPGAAGQE